MPDSYTPNLHFTLQVRGDTSWGSRVNTMLTALDGLSALGGLNVVPFETPTSTSLFVWLTPGTFLRTSDGTEIAFAGQKLTCTANLTNFLWLDNTGTAHVATTGYPAGEILKLARVVAGASTITSIVDDRRQLWTSGLNIVPIFVGSGASHAPGLVPDAGATAGTTRFLREDATWVAIVAFGASGTGHAAGLVPDPGSTAGTSRFLCENATWSTLPAMGASGAGHAAGLVPDPGSTAGTTRFLREDATWASVPAMGASGTGHAAGLVPDPGSTAGTSKFLREDAAWVAITVFGAAGGAHSAGLVPDPGATIDATKYLRDDATWQPLPAMGASGGSSQAGLVPDPGGAAGTTRYLREDAAWVAPPGTVLASLALKNQTAFGLASLYAVSAAGGLFRVAVYVAVTQTGTSGNLTLSLSWTDDAGSQSVTAVSLSITSLGYQYATVIVQGKSGITQNIGYTVAFTGTEGACQYSLYVALQQLL